MNIAPLDPLTFDVRVERLLRSHRATDPVAALLIDLGPLLFDGAGDGGTTMLGWPGHGMAAIGAELREPLDLLVARADGRLLAILSRTTLAEARAVADGIEEAVRVANRRSSGPFLDVAIGPASALAGSLTRLDDLVGIAEAALLGRGAGAAAGGSRPGAGFGMIDHLAWI